MADNLDTQEPEKPKKKKKASGTISMPVFVGSLLGMGLLVAVVVIFILKYVITDPATSGKEGEKTEQLEKDPEKEFSELDLAEQEFLEDEKKRKMIQFERITTNAKGSSKYAIISLSVTFRPHPELPEEELAPESNFMKRIETKTVNVVSGQLRKMDENEIQNTTYEELQDQLRDLMKDFYRKNELFLREILITELFVQN